MAAAVETALARFTAVMPVWNMAKSAMTPIDMIVIAQTSSIIPKPASLRVHARALRRRPSILVFIGQKAESLKR